MKTAQAICMALAIGLLGVALTATAGSVDSGIDPEVQQLQQRWAEANYQLEGKTRLTALETLAGEADRLTVSQPGSAAAWIWSGIIKSTCAGAHGGLGAMKWAKASRADLEHAMEIDAEALDGSAYTSLGTLYFKVPGWPIGFGDDEKAGELLGKALELNPDGIDSNYFHADFLMKQKRWDEAEAALLKAQQAAPRPGRPIADAGRQQEIQVALLKVRDRQAE